MKKVTIAKTLTYTLLVTLLTIYSSTGFGQNRSIEFETFSWKEVIEKAQKENKPIFVDAYATWCGPCKWMSKNVFTNDTVADFYNKNFINVKMDMEKGEAINLAREWKIQAYPTLIYFNSNGELIHQKCGALETGEFIETGENALNPEKQLANFMRQYKNGNREPEFMSNYITQRAQACMESQSELAAYFETQKEEDLSNETNWNLIQMLVKDMDSKAFKYLESNPETFAKRYSKEAVDEKLEQVYSNYLMAPLYQNDKTTYENRKKEVTTKKTAAAKRAAMGVDMRIFKKEKDWTNYIKTADSYIKAYVSNDFQALNEMAWTVFANVKDKKLLTKAMNWAKKSVNLNPNVYNLDTYAHLLHAIDKKEEAISQQKRAIQIAKEAGDPILPELEETLKGFEGQ
jgi:thiol-disulfide isomerase/thioredoxin